VCNKHNAKYSGLSYYGEFQYEGNRSDDDDDDDDDDFRPVGPPEGYKDVLS
jgi:hypothetical protein